MAALTPVARFRFKGTSEKMVTLFHVTSAANAARTLADVFVDGHDQYMSDRMFSGVWLSDRPLEHEGALDDSVLKVSFPCELADLTHFEWIEEGKPYREWLIPASKINMSSIQITVVDSGAPEWETQI